MGMGSSLAHRIQTLKPNHGIDVVVPVPDTGRIFALEVNISFVKT